MITYLDGKKAADQPGLAAAHCRVVSLDGWGGTLFVVRYFPAPISHAIGRWTAGACGLAALGCASQPPAAAPATPTPLVTVAATTNAAPQATKPAHQARPAPPAEGAKPPNDYLEARVGGVVQAAGGPAVVLVDDEHQVAIPIFIGGTEALAIELRHDKKRFSRPLTHDLLDEIMHKLGGQLVRVQIDDIRNDTFIASVFVRQGDQIFELDARASDAIALAIGSRAPIYVAPRVSKKGGLRRPEGGTTPAQPDGGTDPHAI